MKSYRCVICTPTDKLYDKDVEYANVPSEDGFFGVQAGHELTVALTGRGGICTVTPADNPAEKKEFLLFKGATQMMNGILTVLAAFGIAVDDLDREKAEAEAAEIRKQIDSLKEKDDVQDKTTIAISERNLEWYEFQLEYIDKLNAA